MELSIERISGGYYQASEENSPSPDYPSEIETVGSNVNLFDKDNQDMFLNGLVPNNSGGIEKINTDITKNNYIVTIIIPCEPNQEYTISRYLGGKTFYLYEIDKKDLVVGDKITFLKSIGNLGVIKQTITTTSTAKYILLKIYNTYATEPNTYNDLISSVKVEKGSIATPYSPYGMGSVEIDVVNNNIMPILNLGTSWEYTDKGIKNLKKGDGEWITRFDVKKGQVLKFRLQLFSKPSKSTTFTVYSNSEAKIDASFINFYTYNLNQVYERTLIANEDATIEIRMFGNANSETFEFQLWAEIDNLTDYKQHQSQTAIMPVQQEMLNGDYIADVEHHEWGKITLNGNENEFLVTSTIGSDLIAIVFNIDKIKRYSVAKIICDMFTTKILGSVTDINNKNNVRFFEGIAKHSNEDSLQVVISIKRNRLESEDLDGVKKWLRINKPTVYYQLATPINLELTAEQQAVRDTKLYTYKNITNISLSNELASVDISYKKDLDAMFDNIIKQMSSSTSDTIET